MRAQTFADNFDSYTNGSVPTGWTVYTTQTDDPGFLVVTDTGLARSPYNFLAHKGVNISQESTSWIVTPAINVSANQELLFYWREKWSYAYHYSGGYIPPFQKIPNLPNPGLDFNRELGRNFGSRAGFIPRKHWEPFLGTKRPCAGPGGFLTRTKPLYSI